MTSVHDAAYELLRSLGMRTFFGNPGFNELTFLDDFSLIPVDAGCSRKAPGWRWWMPTRSRPESLVLGPGHYRTARDPLLRRRGADPVAASGWTWALDGSYDILHTQRDRRLPHTRRANSTWRPS